jgi:hypothetical protein
VVQVNAADSVVDIGDQRVMVAVSGQGERVLEVGVGVGDSAGVEADPAGQVVQVGQVDPQRGRDPVTGLGSEKLVAPGQVVEHGGVTATAAVAVVAVPARAGRDYQVLNLGHADPSGIVRRVRFGCCHDGLPVPDRGWATDRQPVQFGTAGVLPTQLFGVLAVMGELVVVMVPPWR